MSVVILDSSAILAAILGETGGDEIFERLEDAAIGTVNVAEVYAYAAINDLATDAIDAFFADTGIEVLPFSHDDAVSAGRLAALTRSAGLSLGDRSCLAVAMARKAEVLTADRAWQAFAKPLGLAITLIR